MKLTATGYRISKTDIYNVLTNRNFMTELIWCFEKLEKSIKVDDNYIFPSYGDKVNEFNEFLKVVDCENRNGKFYIKLSRF